MTSFRATWLANVTGVDGSERPAYCRIAANSAYDPDDTFVIGWSESVEADRIEDVAEIMWMRHNIDNRASGRTCRSMSIGDVVVVGEVAYACESMGFRRLDVGPKTILLGTFVEYCEAVGA
ncbi:MAG: hypothetical protein M1522_01555 [Actinobacteria bacterium]|nr:hypothetical protein [Actinomycetota bacterium]